MVMYIIILLDYYNFINWCLVVVNRYVKIFVSGVRLNKIFYFRCLFWRI